MSGLSDRAEKPCPPCQRLLPVESFAKNRTMPDGRQGYCRDYFADLYATKRASQGKVVRRKVDVPDGHKHCRGCDQTKQKQPVCGICLTRRPVHIDHDHETGKVRGMLCFPCNAALGQLQDDPTIIRRAAEYVEGNVWQPIKVAAGAYQLPISLPEARRSPSSSVRTPPIFSRVDVRLLQPR